ncbi:MAG: hypothetical protein B6244_07870 [Candidatus Cloacimonetes bacterium 4572_55]|nr:MAG: hypothetical protein B6244_07870 [Candidatus Cloacimonetes bacterium 4572_55]
MKNLIINVHSIIPYTQANGPGMRTAIWFQGCVLNCPGCYNPQTRSTEPNRLFSVDAVYERIDFAVRKCLPDDLVQGITISGGEPFRQPAGLLGLLQRIRGESDLSILVFSGFTLSEIAQQPHGDDILRHIDTLIAGRYQSGLGRGMGLIGSTNQRIHLLTDRYRLSDIIKTPASEVIIDRNGHVTFTGIFQWASRKEHAD